MHRRTLLRLWQKSVTYHSSFHSSAGKMFQLVMVVEKKKSYNTNGLVESAKSAGKAVTAGFNWLWGDLRKPHLLWVREERQDPRGRRHLLYLCVSCR